VLRARFRGQQVDLAAGGHAGVGASTCSISVEPDRNMPQMKTGGGGIGLAPGDRPVEQGDEPVDKALVGGSVVADPAPGRH
jgi:hypothetical protein